MHNNTNYHGWNKALTFGVGSIQLNFRTIVFTCKDVFNPNVTAFQSNCAEGLHFSAFHLYIIIIGHYDVHTSIISIIIPEPKKVDICN